MERRAFIALASAGLIATPLAATAQQAGKVYTLWYLPLGRLPLSPVFLQSLQSLGWIEGKNVAILYKTAEFRSERLSTLVAELVDRKVNVIVAVDAEAALAAK